MRVCVGACVLFCFPFYLLEKQIIGHYIFSSVQELVDDFIIPMEGIT